jgi:hypothetical protein
MTASETKASLPTRLVCHWSEISSKQYGPIFSLCVGLDITVLGNHEAARDLDKAEQHLLLPPAPPGFVPQRTSLAILYRVAGSGEQVADLRGAVHG